MAVMPTQLDYIHEEPEWDSFGSELYSHTGSDLEYKPTRTASSSSDEEDLKSRDKHKNLRTYVKRQKKQKTNKTKSTVTIKTCTKREDGKRARDKRHYCLYCGQSDLKMARHLQRNHMEIQDVAYAFSFPSGSKDRKVLLEQLRNKGDFKHNTKVLEKGRGQIVTWRQPSDEVSVKDYLPCQYCYGMFAKKVLRKHHCTCRSKTCVTEDKKTRKRVQSLAARVLPIASNASGRQDVITKNVMALWNHLRMVEDKAKGELTQQILTAYRELNETVLVQVIVFNKRHERQASRLTLETSEKASTNHVNEDIYETLSPLERELSKLLTRIEVWRKRGGKVAVFLTERMKESINLLIERREEAGIPAENPYLFARPGAMTKLRGCDCLRKYAEESKAENPELLRSTKLRKQVATCCQLLDLSEQELEQVTRFMGHDIRVHLDFYRQTYKTFQIAKISKLLFAMERGLNLNTIDLSVCAESHTWTSVTVPQRKGNAAERLLKMEVLTSSPRKTDMTRAVRMGTQIWRIRAQDQPWPKGFHRRKEAKRRQAVKDREAME
ncbi:uncharacterized protein LOC122870667 [Siniperca chuatsi]|uniref:uncharacterized protein LOC122870667 n=1 Tax=Siniperca chuatsi TaxID=119488 RepID=UPI001CE0B690|nr:uncharacterized protein LOC122870667 [Siniperca chuatsi]